MENNLVRTLDEIIVLHADVASSLLKKFPKAFGVSFVLDREKLTAYPTEDVPAGHADGYSHAAFERKAEELLAPIAPRLREVMAELAPLSITPRDFFLKATRMKYENFLKDKGALRMTAAVSGGLGSVFVRRSAINVKARVLCDTPPEFHVVGLVDDHSALPGVEAAAAGGLRSYLNHLDEGKLLLNHGYVPASTLSMWVDHFPQVEANEFQHDGPICRLIATTSLDDVAMYFPVGLADQDNKDIGVVEYDPVHGFNVAHAPVPSAPRP